MKNVITAWIVFLLVSGSMYLLPAQTTGSSTSSKKILIVVTSNDKLKDGSPAGYYLPEVTDYIKTLSVYGFDFVVASPRGGKAPMYEREAFLKDSLLLPLLHKDNLLKKLDNTVALASVDARDYAAVHLVGGYASLFDFPSCYELKELVKWMYENNRVVSAVCHGPSGLLNVRLSNGKYLTEGVQLTGRTIEEDTRRDVSKREAVLQKFPIILEEELKKQGAVFTKADPYTAHVEVSNKLVTGQGVSSTTPLAEQVAKLLK